MPRGDSLCLRARIHDRSNETGPVDSIFVDDHPDLVVGTGIDSLRLQLPQDSLRITRHRLNRDCDRAGTSSPLNCLQIGHLRSLTICNDQDGRPLLSSSITPSSHVSALDQWCCQVAVQKSVVDVWNSTELTRHVPSLIIVTIAVVEGIQ